MTVKCPPENIPVLFLYDMDPAWDSRDKITAQKSNEKMMSALKDAGHPVESAKLSTQDVGDILSDYSPEELIVFNQCENIPGIPHSEPIAAKMIESLGFTYTGSTSDVLLLAENKNKTKQILDSLNIPSPVWRIYNEPETAGWNIFPAIVKTACEHCSICLNSESVVMNSEELESRIEYILKNYNQPALVEDFIDGREFHVTVCGNGKVSMFPVVEMDFSAFNDVHDRLCTYDSKFVPGSMHYDKIEGVIPAPLTSTAIKSLEKISLDAYHAIGCRDYARLDVRERDGKFYVLDVNPNADLDSEASVACSAEYAGMSYSKMMTYFVRLAANRHSIYSRSSDKVKKQTNIVRSPSNICSCQ
jgi:D-alanine-D-alanine ligase